MFIGIDTYNQHFNTFFSYTLHSNPHFKPLDQRFTYHKTIQNSIRFFNALLRYESIHVRATRSLSEGLFILVFHISEHTFRLHLKEKKS